MYVMYIYRATMSYNGNKKEPVSVYMYARNKKAAHRFCKNFFGKFDKFDVTKFGEITKFPHGEDAKFLSEDEEKALLENNYAANGEIYAERRGGADCTIYQEDTPAI